MSGKFDVVWIIIGFSAVKSWLCSMFHLWFFARRSILAVHRPPALWRGMMQSRSVSLICHQAYLDKRKVAILSFVGSWQSEMNLWYTLCSDPKRKINIGGRETFGRWTNLVFFSIVCPFVPFNYGEREDRKQYSSSWIHWFPMKT